MKTCIFFLISIIGITSTIRAQERTDEFDMRQIRIRAAKIVYETMVDLTSVSDCGLKDMDRTKSGFWSGAYIQVLTLRNQVKRSLRIPQYIALVGGIVMIITGRHLLKGIIGVLLCLGLVAGCSAQEVTMAEKARLIRFVNSYVRCFIQLDIEEEPPTAVFSALSGEGIVTQRF